MHTGHRGSAKKPYRRPQLVIYGNIRELTQALNTDGKFFDGGIPPGFPPKTGPA